MAARKKAGKLTATAAGDPGALAFAPESGGPVELPDAISYLNSLGGARDGHDWNIRVYKVDAQGRGVRAGQAFLFPVQLDELPDLETQLADSYPGGGAFKVVVRADNVIVKSAMLDIAPRPGWTPPRPSYLAPINPQPENPQADKIENSFLRLGELIVAGQNQTRELIAAIAARPADKPLSFTEQLAAFREFQQLAPQGAQQNGIDMFNKGIEMALKMSEAAGGRESGTTILDIVRDALSSPALKDIVQGAIAGAGAHAALPPPAAQGQQPGQRPAPQFMVDARNPQAVAMMDALLAAAAMGTDPKEIAEKILNIAPPVLLDEMGEQADIPGFIIQQFPQAAPHRAWLAAVVADIWPEAPANDTVPQNAPAPIPAQAPRGTLAQA